jgi:adenylate kinase family enzyme
MYKRIIILGGIGSGKSTLTNRIGLYTGYDVYYLDDLFFNSKWERIDKSEWEEISKIFLSRDSGVVDGNCISTLPGRIAWSDLIIYIDTPIMVQFYRYFKRLIKVRLLGIEKRHGVPDGAKVNFNMKLLIWIYKWDKEKNKIFLLLESIKDKKVLIIKEPRKLDLKKLFE